ncbi:hypothetical protein [Streptomyces sp. CRN 30]|uniref:hypothetical protein n=1 Tax=Streptomyces sp. CRN 30 TaxID=3075613 RepID=UPI002A821506|nr:hypothetical protein [Streptomyces sp. CRN 30]
MATDDTHTGTIKVTEGWLSGIAHTTVTDISRTLRSGDPQTTLSVMSNDAGTYPGLCAASDKGRIDNANELHAHFKSFATSLIGQLNSLSTGLDTLAVSLLEVDQILRKGEEDAELTAGEMAAVLADGLGGLGYKTTTTTA